MTLTRGFSVPAGIEAAWTAFNHLDRLEPCLPGLTLTGRAGDAYQGSLKIKFGPIALVYDGSARYVERDIDARRLVLEIQGEDRRGNGTATATATLTFAQDGEQTGGEQTDSEQTDSEQTDVEVSADLELTGKPAQFGEEVIADTLSKLLDQFVSCVAGRFAEGIGDPAEEDGVEEVSDSEQTVEIDAVPGAAEPTPVPEPAPAAAGPSSAARQPSVARPAAAASQPSGPYRYSPPQNTAQPDVKVVASMASTASVMFKRYGPALGVLSLVVVIAVKIISRLRRR